MSKPVGQMMSVLADLAAKRLPTTLTDKALTVMSTDNICELSEIFIKVIHEVSDNLPITSSLPGSEKNAGLVYAERQRHTLFFIQRPKLLMSKKRFLQFYARKIQEGNSGNCFEYSVLCNHLMRKNQIQSKVVLIQGDDGANHLVVIYQQNETKDFSNEDIVIDALLNAIYTWGERLEYLKLCCFNKINGIVSYRDMNDNDTVHPNRLDDELANFKTLSS